MVLPSSAYDFWMPVACLYVENHCFVALYLPSSIVVEATPSSPSSFGSSNAILLAIVLFSWITAFISMPNWLSAVLDIAIGWLGLVLFMVTGVFVWMAQPSNTLQDPTYVTFLCSIAMVASCLTRILRVIIREENDWYVQINEEPAARFVKWIYPSGSWNSLPFAWRQIQQLPCATTAAIPIDLTMVGYGWMVLPMYMASALWC